MASQHRIPNRLLHFPRNFDHLGTFDRTGHRAGGRFIRAKRPSKFNGNPQSTQARRESRQYVQPQDRVKRFSIHPGDRVRLLTGKAVEKYTDEAKKAAGGYKIYTVREIDPPRNRVMLDGLSNTTSYQTPPKPVDFESRTKAEQDQWLRDTEARRIRLKPIHYSNVSLLVEEDPVDPSNHVFAKRVKLGGPVWVGGQWRWDRFAAATTGPSNLPVDPKKGKIRIDWPVKEDSKTPGASDLDSETYLVHQPSLEIPKTDSYQMFAKLFPSTTSAPPPTDQCFSNEYIEQPLNRSDPVLDLAMPLYLSEELSPRFAKHKVAEAWKLRQALRQKSRFSTGEKAVLGWEEGGRDRGLRTTMDSDEAGLEGVTLRSRTTDEVRDAAMAEFDEEKEALRRYVREQTVAGRTWDLEKKVWVDGHRAMAAKRKKEKKLKKAKALQVRLENLSLSPGKNMVVPA